MKIEVESDVNPYPRRKNVKDDDKGIKCGSESKTKKKESPWIWMYIQIHVAPYLTFPLRAYTVVIL